MPYCKKCNAYVVYGLIDNPKDIKELEQENKKRGKKTIFAGCCVDSSCPECGIPYKDKEVDSDELVDELDENEDDDFEDLEKLDLLEDGL